MRLAQPLNCILVVGAIVLLMLSLTVSAHAHQPFFNDAGSPSIAEAYPIVEPTVSKAIFAAIRISGSIDYYRLDVPADFRLNVQVLVPGVRRCNPFRPSLAVIGQDVAAGGDTTNLEVPEGMQAQVVTAETWGRWQGHGLGLQRTGPQITQRLSAGRYYLAVLHPPGATGEYLLSLAGAERSGGEPNARSRMRAWEACPSGAPAPTPAITRLAMCPRLMHYSNPQ